MRAETGCSTALATLAVCCFLAATCLARICLINGTLLFLGDELVVEAALRRDVVSIQIDDASAAPATWSVVVTGRAELALGHEVPISLQPALERGGTMLALPMTLLVGRRETDVGMSG